jgi:hypothetical protein
MLFTPVIESGMEFGDDCMPSGANQAMRRPDAERVPALSLKLIDVGKRTGVGARSASHPCLILNIFCGDNRKRSGRISIFVLPPNRVSDMDRVVTVQSGVNSVDSASVLPDEIRHSNGVLFCSRDIQRPVRGTEVLLHVNDNKVCGHVFGLLRGQPS